MRRYLWLCPIYLLCALLPLCLSTSRNLEYEYALLCSYLVQFLLPLSAALLFPHLVPRSEDGRFAPYVRLDLLWMLVVGPLCILLPGGILLATNACKCSGNGFLFWMFVQVGPAWFIGHASYHFVLYLRAKNTRFRKIFAFFLILYALVLLYAFIRFWFNPQVRILDLFLGFLHGPIYDRWIPVDQGILLARAAHTLEALSLVLAVWTLFETRRRYIAMGTAVLALGLSFYAGTYASVAIGKSALNELLSGEKTHRLFTMHYKPSDNKKDQEMIQDLYLEAAFHSEELASLLGPDIPHVQIYVYPNQSDKKLWFGGGATDVADVHTPSVHITIQAVPHRSLRHELVHAMASNFGFHGIGFHPNMAITEGLAMALAPEEDDVNLHQGAAMLFASKRMPSLGKLFSPMFWQVSGARAYTVAGSIILFLKDRYGMDAVKALYHGASWQEALKISRNDALKAWRDFVLKNYKVESADLLAEALFRNPGVLYDLCPHSKADMSRERGSSFALALRQPIGWQAEDDYLPWRLRIDRKDRDARVQFLKKKLKLTYTEHAKSEKQLESLASDIWSISKWPPKSTEDIDLALTRADLAYVMGRNTEDSSTRSTIEAYLSEHRLDDATHRAVAARRILSNILPAHALLPWREFLAGWRKDLPAQNPKEPWFLSYLRLRNADKSIAGSEQLRALAAVEPPEGLHSSFYTEWYKILAYRLAKEKDFALAQQLMIKALNSRPPSLRDFYELELRRLRYFSLTSPAQ